MLDFPFVTSSCQRHSRAGSDMSMGLAVSRAALVTHVIAALVMRLLLSTEAPSEVDSDTTQMCPWALSAC